MPRPPKTWATERNIRLKFGHSSLCNCMMRFRGRLIKTVRKCDCKDENGDFKTSLPYDEIERYGLPPGSKI